MFKRPCLARKMAGHIRVGHDRIEQYTIEILSSLYSRSNVLHMTRLPTTPFFFVFSGHHVGRRLDSLLGLVLISYDLADNLTGRI